MFSTGGGSFQRDANADADVYEIMLSAPPNANRKEKGKS